MDSLIESALDRALSKCQGPDALHVTSGSNDIASYQRHWNKCCGGKGVECLPTADAQSYLTAEMAHSAAVDRVFAHLGVGGGIISAQQFHAAAHFLHRAISSAQEAMFENDDFFADAPPPSFSASSASGGKLEANAANKERQQRGWMIGTVAAAMGIAPEEERTDGMGDIADEAAAPASSAGGGGGVAGHWRAGSCSPVTPAISAAVSLGSEGPALTLHRSDSTATSSLPVAARTLSPLVDAEWAAFNTAFANLGLEAGVGPALGPAWGRHMRTVSLAGAKARLATVPGTGLPPMDQSQRQRYEAAFTAKGYEAGGGLQEAEARRILERSFAAGQLPPFRDLWRLSNTTSAGALDKRQFCLLMHLLQAAAQGFTLPVDLDPVQVAQLLGDVALTHAAAEASPFHLDPAKLRAARAADQIEEGNAGEAREAERAMSDGGSETPSAPPRHLLKHLPALDGAGESSTPLRNAMDQHDDDDDASGANVSFTDSDDDSEAADTEVSFVSASWRNEALNPSKKPGASPGGASGGSAHIPRLPVPLAAPRTALERAAWEAEVGRGHTLLQLRLQHAVLMERRALDRPFLTLSVRDLSGRLVELPQDSHPGIYDAASSTINFNQSLTLGTALRSLPPGCLLFLEVRQWKGDKQRFSTVTWTFVDCEMMIDAGPTCSRVRCGPMVLPMFKKPVDPSLRRLKRLNGRGPAMYLTVVGLE